MKNDRLGTPVDSTYLAAIGLATYCFARLEWSAVYCGEKLSPGYVYTVAEKTAGTIAREVAGFAGLITDQNKRTRFRAAADEFVRLKDRRNDLVHANPVTVDGEQRLVRHGTPWLLNAIDDLSDEFTACSLELHELYQHVL